MHTTIYTIDRGIPIPAPKRSKGSSIYPFGSMKVGDSFLVPFDANVAQKLTKSRIGNAVTIANKRYEPCYFSMRVVDSGVRVWRVE